MVGNHIFWGQQTGCNLGSPLDRALCQTANGSKILHSACYIWDKELRNHLAKVCDELARQINASIAADGQNENAMNMSVKVVSTVLSLVSIALGFSDEAVIADIAFGTSLGGFLFDAETAAFMDLIFPDNWQITKANLASYYSTLAAALSTAQEGYNEESIMIPFYYTMAYSVENIELTTWNIDFAPEITPTSYACSPTYLPAYYPDSYFLGTITDFRNAEELDDAIGGERGVTSLDIVGSSVIPVNTGSSTIGIIEHTSQYQWYSFAPSETNVYSFFTEGSGDTTGELFFSLKTGRSNSGVIESDDDSGENLNFGFAYKCYQGHTYYIRVHGYNYLVKPSYVLKIVASSVSPIHYHYYGSYYIDLNKNNHKAMCTCGLYVTERHAYAQSFQNGKITYVCAACGHVKGDEPGIIGPIMASSKLNSSDVTFGLADGSLVLSSKDVASYIAGDINI